MLECERLREVFRLTLLQMCWLWCSETSWQLAANVSCVVRIVGCWQLPRAQMVGKFI